MSKLRTLSGEAVVKILVSFGFEVVNQHGSHVKLRRHVGDGSQTLVVPEHKVLKKGTLRSLCTQASRYVGRTNVEKHFYTE